MLPTCFPSTPHPHSPTIATHRTCLEFRKQLSPVLSKCLSSHAYHYGKVNDKRLGGGGGGGSAKQHHFYNNDNNNADSYNIKHQTATWQELTACRYQALAWLSSETASLVRTALSVIPSQRSCILVSALSLRVRSTH